MQATAQHDYSKRRGSRWDTGLLEFSCLKCGQRQPIENFALASRSGNRRRMCRSCESKYKHERYRISVGEKPAAPRRRRWDTGATEGQCIKCATVKPIDQFPVATFKGVQYRRRFCSDCFADLHKFKYRLPPLCSLCRVVVYTTPEEYRARLCESCRGEFDKLRQRKCHLCSRCDRVKTCNSVCMKCRLRSKQQVRNELREQRKRNIAPRKKTANQIQREQWKRAAMESRHDRCQSCGLHSTIPAVFDFDHRDPQDKVRCLSQCLTREDYQAEVVKCDMLCVVCHRLRHWLEHHPEDQAKAEEVMRRVVTK
jgi:hypothetical protein